MCMKGISLLNNAGQIFHLLLLSFPSRLRIAPLLWAHSCGFSIPWELFESITGSAESRDTNLIDDNYCVGRLDHRNHRRLAFGFRLWLAKSVGSVESTGASTRS